MFKHTLALLAFATAAHAIPAVTPPVEITDAVAQGVPAGNTTRVTARLINPTSASIVITKLTSPLAENARLVLFRKNAEGLTEMAEQTTLTLPPGETLILPNVLEWRLERVQTSLSEGTEIPLTLTFANGTTRTYKAQVK